MGEISISHNDGRLSIDYDGVQFVSDSGIGLPVNRDWLWSFDGSLKLVDEKNGRGQDSSGEFRYRTLVYSAPALLGQDIPLIRQTLKSYDDSRLLIETTALEDIRGTYLEDSFYHTTFNSPVMLLQENLNFLAYTWGLIGIESSRDGGHFPEAVTGKGVSNVPSKLRLAGYAPRQDLRTNSQKPFCPIVLYDDDGRTLVVSPFDHFLISPMRVIQTPSGTGIARGLHGSVNTIPKGTTTRTAMVFGDGVVETMLKWGDWLLKAGGKKRDRPSETPLLGGVGFWNCFGGYYTELFRKVDEKTLKELAAYFRREGIPISYFGLDLWYNYGEVGFARNYRPDAGKYPKGLEPIHEETGLPYLLHMSAFESPNDYMGSYEFVVDKESAYPQHRNFYEDLSKEFKSHGAFGIWPDFLRSQLQNSSSLRSMVGAADRWFDNLAGAFGDEDMVMMMCMPTTGHYLASTRHQNVVAVRTHTDYLNHQKSQVDALRVTGQVRNYLPPQQSVRHNVLLSFLGYALGLSPSFDVFLTNKNHPEGFAEPNAEYEALLRAMNAGVVAIGDKAGFIDKEIVRKLLFPDGRTSMPDHPPLPVVSSLQSDVLAFYTSTTVGSRRWIYLALFNVGDKVASYALDLKELAVGEDVAVYDYFGAKMLKSHVLQGKLDPAHGNYYIVVPPIGPCHFLGFPDKYITVSSRQIIDIEENSGRITVKFRLPPPIVGTDPESPKEYLYTVALHGRMAIDIKTKGADVRRVYSQGDLEFVEFAATSSEPTLTIGP